MADAGVPKTGDVIHASDLEEAVCNISSLAVGGVRHCAYNTYAGSSKNIFDSVSSMDAGNDTSLVEKKAVVDALAKKIEGLVGIDTTNLLYWSTDYLASTTGYTATQDCWVTGRCYPNTATENKFILKIDSADMGYINAYLGEFAIAGFGPIPLKKGQRLTFFVEGRVEYTYRVYGVLI